MDCSTIQFQYTNAFSATDLDQLVDLFKAAAFWAQDRTREDMAIAVAHSHPIVTAWDGPQLIGFARATSDGVFRATIWDVVISPNYQGGGLGRRLVETLVAHPHMSRVERVYLMTTNQQGFYARIGFEENPSTTMVLYNNAEIEMLPALSPPAEVPAKAQITVH
jgi:N-acetylglutamate synthase-like GNAT family acetyltransferase